MELTCDALVVRCIDFRLRRFIRNFTDTRLAGKNYDVVSMAGATKNWDRVMRQVDTSKRLHGIKLLVLINHEDCGAYEPGEGTPERHTADLRKAKDGVLAKYPDLHVELYYLHMNGIFEPVE